MLAFHYELTDFDPDLPPVYITENRGVVTFHVSRGLPLEEALALVEAAAAELLAGGQWFQLWRGEIISMESPEIDGGSHGGIHRGPLVDQAPGSRHR